MRLSDVLRVTGLAAALALGATACGSDDAGTDLATVDDGQLTVCADIPYAPFAMENEEGTGYTGFDIELMRAIADQLGLELDVAVTGFDAIHSGQAFATDACDVAASAMTVTEEREEHVDFTDPYFDAGQSLLTRSDAGVSTLDDVGSLGVQADTPGQAYAQENFAGEILVFPGADEAFSALEAGSIDAILQDVPANADRAQQDDSVEVVDTYPTGEQYGFAVAEGNTALRDAINDALASVREESTYDELHRAYFGT